SWNIRAKSDTLCRRSMIYGHSSVDARAGSAHSTLSTVRPVVVSSMARPHRMKRLPVGPLRAFDVAARHLNLSAAAEEMNVTHAAVSRQVKQLEQRLGVKLFERLPRGLKLTAHGALLAEGTRQAFDRLASAIADVSVPAVRRKLTISTFASLSARWLMPRVGSFAALFPDVDLQVVTGTRLVDFAREDVDIGIRFGGGNYPGLHVVPLFKPREIAVCAPSLLERGPAIKTFADLRHHTLLHDDSHRAWT